MKEFTDARRYLWLGAVALLVTGVLLALLVLPAMSDRTSSSQPEIHVPQMQNVPPPEAPKLRIQ